MHSVSVKLRMWHCWFVRLPSLRLYWRIRLFKDALRKNMLIGSLIALVGVGLVVFSGSVILKINPLGDFLSIMAALMWAIYCLVLKPLGHDIPPLSSPKGFLYSILSVMVYFIYDPLLVDMEILTAHSGIQSAFLGHSGFHALLHCLECSGQVLGPSRTANYIYFSRWVPWCFRPSFFPKSSPWLLWLEQFALLEGFIWQKGIKKKLPSVYRSFIFTASQCVVMIPSESSLDSSSKCPIKS